MKTLYIWPTFIGKRATSDMYYAFWNAENRGIGHLVTSFVVESKSA